MNYLSLVTEFYAPSAKWRGKPFWAWNGDLKADELIRQIDVMKEMGLGGHFMHSRVGLQTEYLGEDWFKLINQCTDYSASVGLEAWLYDEDRWPSGSAGGLVTEDPALRMRFIHADVQDKASWVAFPNAIATFTANVNGVILTELQREKSADFTGCGTHVVQFYVHEMPSGSFYNGNTYLDTMNPLATKRFIELTHEKYKAACGARLGTTIRGIFTDEPHRGSLMTTFGQGVNSTAWLAPWTDKMPEHWAALTGGRDIADDLPFLFFQIDGQIIHEVKWKYSEVCLQLFLKNYCEPLRAWCDANGLDLTGHFLHEDNLTSQTAMVGSVMRGYSYLSVPGMDLLGEGNRCFWVAKQLQSASRQLGAHTRMSELYGCTGWQMPLSGHKHVGDWQALFGINLRCHHLSWYSMDGEAKRDYPASILDQSAWYTDYERVETYFARLGVLLSTGQTRCDVLVIHPVETIWAQVHPGWCNGLSPASPGVCAAERDFEDVFHSLQGGQIDFDYADEGMLDELGSVTTDDGGLAVLTVGMASYKCVVVAGCQTIRSSTLKRLEAFTDAGGVVYFAGDRPAYVDAKPSTAAAQLGVDVDGGIMGLPDALRAFAGVILTPKQPHVFHQIRILDTGEQILVLLNVDREQPTGTFTADFKGESCVELCEWDCLSGSVHAVNTTSSEGARKAIFNLGAGGLLSVVSSPVTQDIKAVHSLKPDPSRVETTELCGPFTYTLSEPNILVLDRFTLTLDDALVCTESDVLRADRMLRARLGLQNRGGEMLQPWFAALQGRNENSFGSLKLSATFCIADSVDIATVGPIYIALEQRARWSVCVNKMPVSPDSCGTWVDHAIERLEIPIESLRSGLNVIEFTTQFRADTNLEAVYLLGQFGVHTGKEVHTITKLPSTLSVGDVVQQGLPFYSACIAYHLPLTNHLAGGCATDVIRVTVPEIAGACVRFNVDGTEHRLPWAPFKWEFERGQLCGDVRLVVVLTRRNTFGPLHQLPMVARAYGPDNWTTQGEQFQDEPVLYPAGLLQPPRIEILRPSEYL